MAVGPVNAEQMKQIADAMYRNQVARTKSMSEEQRARQIEKSGKWIIGLLAGIVVAAVVILFLLPN